MFVLRKCVVFYLLFAFCLFSCFKFFLTRKQANSHSLYLKYLEKDAQTTNMKQQVIEPLFIKETMSHLV